MAAAWSIAGVRIASVTSSPSITTLSFTSNDARDATAATADRRRRDRRRRDCAFHATRAIHRAGVHVTVAEPRGNRACDCSFAGAGRAVDGDDDLGARHEAARIIPGMSPRRKRWIVLVSRRRNLRGTCRGLADHRNRGAAARPRRMDVVSSAPAARRRRRDLEPKRSPIQTRHGPVDARIDRPAGGADHTLVGPARHAPDRPGRTSTHPIHHAPRWRGHQRRLLCRCLTCVHSASSADRQTRPKTSSAGSRRTGASRRPDASAWPGVSFAGGLALVAAGRPSLRGRLDTAVSLGGHGDLGTVLDYLCTGRLPDGTVRAAARLQSGRRRARRGTASRARRPKRPISSAGSRSFSRRQPTSRRDTVAAATQLAEAGRLRDAMPERSQQVMDWVLERDVQLARRGHSPVHCRARAATRRFPRSGPPRPAFLSSCFRARTTT